MIANSIDVSNVPNEISILPLGDVASKKGNFKVDEESIQEIITSFKNRKLDLVIDYEHQTLENVQAPAAGWIKDMYQGTNALIAKVEWTDHAKEYLAHKEYKYLSPVIMARTKDRKAIGLHSVALTNTPAIDGMFPIVNSLAKETPMNSSEQDILTTILQMLGLSEQAEASEVEAKIQELLQEKTKAENELKEMKYLKQEEQIDDVIQTALKTGKLSACMIENAKKMAAYDLEAFKSYIDQSPVLVPVNKIEYANNQPNQIDSKISSLLGIKESDIKEYRQ